MYARLLEREPHAPSISLGAGLSLHALTHLSRAANPPPPSPPPPLFPRICPSVSPAKTSVAKAPSESRTAVVYEFGTQGDLADQYRNPWNHIQVRHTTTQRPCRFLLRCYTHHIGVCVYLSEVAWKPLQVAQRCTAWLGWVGLTRQSARWARQWSDRRR